MKKYLKVTVAILLGVTTMLSTAGCGKGAIKAASGAQVDTSILSPKTPIALEIWHYYNGSLLEQFSKLTNEFNETVGFEKGIVVEAVGQGSVDGLANKVMESAKRKVGSEPMPNIVASYADTAYELHNLDMITNLDDYLTQDELNTYVDSFLSEGQFSKDGPYKIFPIAKSTEVLMLDMTQWDTFAKAKGASLDTLATCEGITSTAQTYYEWTDSLTPDILGDGKAFFGRDALANYLIIGNKQMGIELFDSDNGKATFHLDKAAMRRIWDNYYVPIIKGYFCKEGKFRSDDMKTGKLIAYVGSSSGVSFFPDKIIQSDIKSYDAQAYSMPVPVFEGGEKIAVQQGAGMVVLRSDQAHELAAVEFLKWFTERERNFGFSVASGYLPVKKDALSEAYLKEYLETEKEPSPQKVEDALEVSIQMANDYTFYAYHAFKGGNDARRVLETSLAECADENLERVEALVASGTSKEEAMAPYLTDEVFEAWFKDLESRLNETSLNETIQ